MSLVSNNLIREKKVDSRKLLIVILMLVFVTGCLQTRSNLRGGQAAPAATPQQQKAAEEAIQKEDSNKEFRELYGRIENVEKQLADTKSNEPLKALDARIAAMETELNLMRTTVSELNAKAKKDALMQSSDERAGNKAQQPKAHFKSPLADATQHFNDKKWEDAILAYEEYRKHNPKGAEYPEATLKIGMCFQNMSLKDDAKVFYKEVVEKFPKFKEAATAKSKLKKL
jgi:tetratricopeptide (TPR) repeat protein